MISTLLTMYAAGTLMSSGITPEIPHVIPWNENGFLEETAIPEKNELNIEPIISAKSALAVDLQTGVILYKKNIHEPLPIASLTKLMTAMIILEENDLQEVATVSGSAAQTPGSKAWLAQGEKITVENLLTAALVGSANDAAAALAEHNSETPSQFVEKMNQKAKELGMVSTTYINPTGLDEDIRINPVSSEETESAEQLPTKGNLSTAYDLALLSKQAFGKSFIRRTVVKKEEEITSENGQLTHAMKATNELLNSYLKVLGLKTGTTPAAGECLIAIIENEDGHTILTVVLGSTARYTETKILADWTLRTYTWHTRTN